MSAHPLKVHFRGTRTYIQGSLILSAAATALTESGLTEQGNTINLVKAKFSTITDKGLSLLHEDKAPTPQSTLIGDATFRIGEAVKTVYFFEDDTVRPQRDDDRGSLLTNVTISEPLNGVAQYKILPSLDELLGAVVEAVKALHTALGDNVYDVWFTGFSGAKLPIKPDDVATSGTIKIQNMMRRGTEEQYQTLFRIKLSQEGDAPPQSFMLSFAYKAA